MQDSPARRSQTKSGGGIITMTFMIVDTNFIVVTTQIGSHHGEDRGNIFLLQMKDNPTW